jgi:hypothetical protein
MKGWQKGLLITLVAVLICGGYLLYVFKSRQDPGVIGKKTAEQKLSQDDLAVVKMRYMTTFSDAQDQLQGKQVWIKAGYMLPYFPFKGGSVQWNDRVGELPSAAKLSISKVIKAVVPAKLDDRVAHGTKQYLAVFTLDGSDQSYAAPIGAIDASNEVILCDQLFYYDPPQKIYDNWPLPVWKAVKTHTPILGMSENQARMAVGLKMETEGTDEGDRTVTYHAGPKTWTVTFVKNQATSVKAS